MKLGDRIAAEMAKRGWSEGEMARRAGVTQPTVHRIVTGESESPRQSNVDKIAKALDVSTDYLWRGVGRAAAEVSNAAMLGSDMNELWHPDLVPISVWDDDTPLDDDEVEVPFLKEVELAAGSGRTVVQQSTNAKLRFGKQTLRKNQVQFDKAVCVIVHGNSMEPVLPHGATVGVNQGDTAVIDGKMYAINHDGQLRVKLLYRLPGGGLRLRSFNRDEHADEDYSPEEIETCHIAVIGRVFWGASFY